jgi:hypothetical protein
MRADPQSDGAVTMTNAATAAEVRVRPVVRLASAKHACSVARSHDSP